MTRDCLIVHVAFDILEKIQLLNFGIQSSGQPDHSISYYDIFLSLLLELR